MKVDVLGLGMLGCMRRAFDLLRSSKNIDLDLATIPAEDPATYAMIRKADTVGVFQIESRAQMSMLPRLKPKTFLRSRHRGRDRPARARSRATWSIPICAAGKARSRSNSPSRSWKRCSARRSACRCFRNRRCRSRWSRPASRQLKPISCAARWRRSNSPAASTSFKDKLIKGMIDNGYDTRIRRTHLPPARRLRQLRLSRKPRGELRADRLRLELDEMPSSGCLLRRDPQRAADGVLRARPAGARRQEHGVEVRPIDANKSSWDCTLEPADGKYHAVRLGLRMTRGLPEKDGNSLVAARAHGLIRASPSSRGARGSGQARWCDWRRRTPLPRWGFHAGRRRGPSKGCETRRCRSSKRRNSERRRLCRSRSRRKSRFPP